MDSYSEYFNKLVNSNLLSQHGKSLEENISLLTKDLCTKDEIIKRQTLSQHKAINFTKLEQNITVKNIYVGNLVEDINKQDICETFGSNWTSYLRDTCNIDFPVNNKTLLKI